jgi:histone-lysine N-methyltransferase SETMAR
VPDGRTINAEVYSKKLEKIYTALLEKYPSLVNRKLVLLQQDNTRPHMAKKTLHKIEELEGIELLPHPVFSPDLEPSDYYLCHSMAQFLRGRKFQSVADVKVVVEEYLLTKIKIGFTRHSRNWLKNG